MMTDGHAHVRDSPRSRLSPDEPLRAMDATGVEKAVVSPFEQHLAILNFEGNDYMAGVVAEDPNRFIGFAAVNPWYLKRGVAAEDSGC